MKKIFEFNIDNTIDIITNSSSELFVLQGRTKELVESMIVMYIQILNLNIDW